MVSEGSYPFYPGGVSLWCQQLVQGMPETSFTAVSLTVDGTERCAWEVPDNVTDLVNLPLWGPRPRRRQLRGAPPAAFTKRYQDLLRTLLAPPAPEDETAHADQFVAALRGLYEYAREGDLTSAMTCNDSLDQLRRAWHDAGLDSGRRPDAVGPLTLRDAFVAADRIEHLLRPLSHPPVQADVCHLAMNGVSALVALSSKWAYGTPMVMSEHGVYLRERYLGLSDEDASKPVKIITMRFNRYLAAGAYRNANVLAPHSSYNRRWQLFGGADPARMQTMYNGINPDEFPVAQGEPEEPTIVFVGRIDPLKDLHTLIRAFAIVRDKIPNARLRIFGPVPPGNEQYQASCVQLAAELGLSGAATFEGRIPRQTDAYQAGHLVALTSVSEGFPYTVVESMATGRPQVCTNVGGVSEAVGDGGFVVPPRDPEAVAAACIRLLEDPDLRRNFGLRARQRVMDRFTLDQWTNAYREIYAELVAGGQPEAIGTPGVPAPPTAQETVGSGASTSMLPTGSRTARGPVRAADGPSPGAGMLSCEDSQGRLADRPLVAPAGQAGRPGQARNAPVVSAAGADDDTVPRPAPRDPDIARQAGPVLVITAQGSEIRLQAGQSCTVGRDPVSGIVVADLRVSWRHAVVRFAEDGWILEDAGSTNGTFVGSGKVDRHPITSDCAFRLGQPEDGPLVRCSVISPEPRAASIPAPRTASVSAPRAAVPKADSGTVTFYQPVRGLWIGRATDNDLVVDDLAASRYHAIMQNSGDGKYQITDLDSHNGTFVNGQPISSAVITQRDTIGIGRAAFRLVGDKLREFGNREGETAVGWAHENGQLAPEPVTEPVKKEPVAAPVKNWWEAL